MARRVRNGLAAAACVGVTGWMAGCGGNSDTDAEPSTEALITTLCEKQAAVACATADTEEKCLAELHENEGFAKQEGCEAELAQYLKCASAKPVTCEGYDGVLHPQVDEACFPLNDAFWECYTRLPGQCAVGMGVPGYTDVACTIKCPTLSSLCHGPSANGPVECTCDSGPRAGTAFQATDCTLGLIWATGHNCT